MHLSHPFVVTYTFLLVLEPVLPLLSLGGLLGNEFHYNRALVSVNPLATNLALYLVSYPSLFCFLVKTHLLSIGTALLGRSTRCQVPIVYSWFSSTLIASCHSSHSSDAFTSCRLLHSLSVSEVYMAGLIGSGISLVARVILAASFSSGNGSFIYL